MRCSVARFFVLGLILRGRPRKFLPLRVCMADIAASVETQSTKQYEGFSCVKGSIEMSIFELEID